MIGGLFSLEQLFIGSCHVGVSTAYAVQFVNYLCPKKLTVQRNLTPQETAPGRLFNRISSGVNLLGGLARFGDWILLQKWAFVPFVQAVALKIIAHGTGVFYYFNKALDASKAINKIEAIMNSPVLMISCTPLERNALHVRKYAEWANLFSNIVLATYSGVQLASLITGVVVLSTPILNILLVVGFVSMAVFWVFRMKSNPSMRVINFFDASMGERHSYLA
jgi:hypothetical protein